MNNTFINKKIKNEIKLIKAKLSIIEKYENINFKNFCHDSIQAIEEGKKIIFFGNGGSAADAQHLATELTVRYKFNRKALPAVSLSTDTSAITAIGNDLNFNKIFSRQIEAIGNKGDIILAITTSGKSQNILEAIKVAKKKNIKLYCFVGNNGGKVKKICKNLIIFPKTSTSVTQVMQIAIGQIYCEILENYFFN